MNPAQWDPLTGVPEHTHREPSTQHRFAPKRQLSLLLPLKRCCLQCQGCFPLMFMNSRDTNFCTFCVLKNMQWLCFAVLEVKSYSGFTTCECAGWKSVLGFHLLYENLLNPGLKVIYIHFELIHHYSVWCCHSSFISIITSFGELWLSPHLSSLYPWKPVLATK